MVSGGRWCTASEQVVEADDLDVAGDADARVVQGGQSTGRHVCLGDPAFHSSGVHEAGYVAAWRLPVRRGVIPTLGVVDGTLEAAPERVRQIIDDAHAYADRFLSAPSVVPR